MPPLRLPNAEDCLLFSRLSPRTLAAATTPPRQLSDISGHSVTIVIRFLDFTFEVVYHATFVGYHSVSFPTLVAEDIELDVRIFGVVGDSQVVVLELLIHRKSIEPGKHQGRLP